MTFTDRRIRVTDGIDVVDIWTERERERERSCFKLSMSCFLEILNLNVILVDHTYEHVLAWLTLTV